MVSSRIEAWQFMLAGGAGFNHLNGDFTAENPAGNTPGTLAVLQNLKNLQGFMAGFEIARFYMDKDTVIEMSEPGTIRGISDRQDRFTFYLHHSSLIVQQHHTTQPGRYGGTLTLRLPEGLFSARWLDPETARYTAQATVKGGDAVRLEVPEHRVDIVLDITRVS